MNRYDILEEYWVLIYQIHMQTKHYTILAEELDDDFKMFLQPMKELKDAYEHIVRAHTVVFNAAISDDEYEKYIIENMKKALGHEYRAFFDTADWFAIICRKKIVKLLREYKHIDLISTIPDYGNIKLRINQISEMIAKIRENKDIGKEHNLIDEINGYCDILNELYSYFKSISELIFTKQIVD